MTLHSEADDPIRKEALRLLSEDPSLGADIGDFNRRLDAGEIDPADLLTTAEVRRRLGLPPPEPVEAAPEPG
jgi:hypothetical protein